MATKVAINGFGRIGRLVARAILESDDHDLDLVSINDLADTKSNAILFQYDSTHGRSAPTLPHRPAPHSSQFSEQFVRPLRTVWLRDAVP